MSADTDSPEVREWAEAVYEAYESGAVLREEYTRRGFREAMETPAGTSEGIGRVPTE